MTANTQTKAAPKWKLWLRRLTKPRPYWQKRLGEQLERERRSMVDLGIDHFATNIAAVLTRLALSALMLALLIPVIRWLFLSPGFLEYGLADPIGRGLAVVCLATGRCELPALLFGVAFAVPTLTAMVLMTWRGFYLPTNPDEDGTVSDEELVTALGAIDERLVHLRADLVLAGVLPLSAEEKAELPAATYTPGLHPWPNPEEALTDMVKAERAASAREANERLIQKQSELDASAARAYLTSPVPAPEAAPIAYTRPELTREHQAEAGMLAVNFTNNRSTAQIRSAVAVLLCENQRLTLEANEHRAARGIEPLPTFGGK